MQIETAVSNKYFKRLTYYFCYVLRAIRLNWPITEPEIGGKIILEKSPDKIEW